MYADDEWGWDWDGGPDAADHRLECSFCGEIYDAQDGHGECPVWDEAKTRVAEQREP